MGDIHGNQANNSMPAFPSTPARLDGVDHLQASEREAADDLGDAGEVLAEGVGSTTADGWCGKVRRPREGERVQVLDFGIFS